MSAKGGVADTSARQLIHLLQTVAPQVSVARPRQLATRARHRRTKPKSILAPHVVVAPNINAWWTAYVLAGNRPRNLRILQTVVH